MKYLIVKHILLLGLFLTVLFTASWSQETTSQEFTIPLSNPNSPGTLKVHSNNGMITVEGYDGNEVLINMKKYYHNKKDQGMDSRNGLKRIPNNGSEVQMTEKDNVVRIEGQGNNRSDLSVKVPRNFSLSLHTHHNGDINVSNVSGEIELNGHHGGIRMENVAGSVIANTHHGEIIGDFTSVKQGKPMAFSTYHGDIDITFPSGTQALAKIKSERGDIFTDFEFQVKQQAPTTESASDGKGTKIFVSGWIYADLGGGGPEFMFNTHHGDVVIRKAGE